MKARITNIRWESTTINAFRLEPLSGESFPPFTAGAHIDVNLSNGLIRSYSLYNDPAQSNLYEIGVQKDPESRGGSVHIHNTWKAGDIVEISEPKNNFPLHEDAPETILIAGGVGVTPMLSMIARLETLNKPWRLYYGAKSSVRAAFTKKLQDRQEVMICIADDPVAPKLDLDSIILEASPEAHIYCCGPQGMLEAFVAKTAQRPSGRSHIEYFNASTEIATGGGYSLILAQSGQTIEVNEGETMLDAMLDAGVDIGFACLEGVCGTCKVKVLNGVLDHRDHFLTEEEKSANSAVIPCCSTARSETLELDI